MLGYLLATASSFFFSAYTVPRKLSKLPPLQYSLLMATGFFASSCLLYLLRPVLDFHETVSLTLLWSVLAGAIWATAFVTFVRAIDTIGLSRSNQWKNLQGPVAVVLGLLLLGESRTTRPVLVLGAGVTVFFSALCFTISHSKQEAKSNLTGVYLAILSGLGFGTTAIIQKHITAHGLVYTQQVVFSFCIALSIAIYISLTYKELPNFKLQTFDSRLAFAAGVLYLGASFLQLEAYRHLPASIVFTLIQLNAVWTISIGIFWFKELSVRKHYKRLLAGLFFALSGIVLLALAKK